MPPVAHTPCISIHTPHAGSDIALFEEKQAKAKISIHTPHAGSDTTSRAGSKKEKISIHTPHAGSDICHSGCPPDGSNFNPHSPCGERQDARTNAGLTVQISIHTPHAGSDCSVVIYTQDQYGFQSTLPMRGATWKCHDPKCAYLFQSTLPMRGATRVEVADIQLIKYFNPHSPCGERLHGHWLMIFVKSFQSTLPMRGATAGARQCRYIYPISIHTPHAGSDHIQRGRHGQDSISIHTPHAGSDVKLWRKDACFQNFNPHSPCGERLLVDHRSQSLYPFQSTLPMRGATGSA